MSQPRQMVVDPHEILAAVVEHKARWLVPAVVITLGSLGYALFHEPSWEATQALVLRDEAVGGLTRLGKFSDADSMKSALETLVELTRSRAVVGAALAQIGPPAGYRNPNLWPTLKDIESAQALIKISAPNGAEFGKTEVVHLRVKNTDRTRAVSLTKALGQQLDLRLTELRGRKATSLADELANVVKLAHQDLDAATSRLAKIEHEVGTDLGELRILSESGGGEGNLRKTQVEIKNEQRTARANKQAHEELLSWLKTAERDPSQLVAMPNEVLAPQPALRRLKDGLIDAQLSMAKLLGEMSANHPKVLAAKQSQQEIRRRLHEELSTAIRGLEGELHITTAKCEGLERQLADVSQRMSRLATLRADYSNQISDVKVRAETLKNAEQKLADARGSQAAAHSASTITRLDEPATADNPVGPRRSMIVAAGLAGGLLAGAGILFLTVPFGPIAARERADVDRTIPLPRRRNSYAPAKNGALKSAWTKLVG